MKIINCLRENYILIAILLLSVFLRFYHLDFQSIWLDEIFTMNETNPKLSFKEFVSTIHFREGMGHFYFLIVRTLNEIFTYSTYTARMFSALIGVLSVFYSYKLGKTIFSKSTGLIAATLLAVNWFAISYSQEARPYMLYMFFVIVSYYRMIIFIKKPTMRNATFYGFAAALIFNSHTIGILNIFSQYLLLFFIFLISPKDKKSIFFKNGVVIFFVTFIGSLPMFQMFMKMTEFKSGWIQIPGPGIFTEIFSLFLGHTELLSFTFSLLIIFYLITVFNQKNIKVTYDEVINNKPIFSCLILFSWFFFPILLPILKTYLSEPMILHRYFIALIPALTLMIAIGIDLIKNKISKILVIVVIISFALTDLILIKDYYNKVTKTEFREITNLIIKRNKKKDKIVSTYGWLMSYFFNQDGNGKPVVESDLESYVISMRNNVVPMESFWYMDGNSLPYKLSPDSEQFLKDNFKLKESFAKYDTWAHHYISKNPPKENPFPNLESKNFTPANFDSNGNLMMFENGIIKSPLVNFEKGKYSLTIKANSLPNQKLNGENAHLIIKLNGQKIANYYLSEKTEEMERTFDFEINTNKRGRILIIFDNDIFVNNLDRNVVIYGVQLQKK
ncbi:glycosyltransferase family 39 protein [Flavobacterium sp. XGLA_31]|uniref:glycosyltransferase family 39 protein n=1 Tax=Flavobacterium sp. XGLA_31 TaxID=3447666 RepID=UPI003F3F9091